MQRKWGKIGLGYTRSSNGPHATQSSFVPFVDAVRPIAVIIFPWRVAMYVRHRSPHGLLTSRGLDMISMRGLSIPTSSDKPQSAVRDDRNENTWLRWQFARSQNKVPKQNSNQEPYLDTFVTGR